MKIPRHSILGSGILLVLLLNGFAQSQPDWESWVENYYLQPDAGQVVPAVHALSRGGYFEKPGQPAIAIGFLGAVFARNPDRVDEWMLAFRDLPAAHRRLVASALWYSGSPRGGEMLRELARHSDATTRAEIEMLASSWTQPSLEATPVLSKASLDLQWGAFLGSGDRRHVLNILAALGSERRALGNTARLALARKALAHPRVFEICQAELAEQPAGIREQLSAALQGRTR